MSERLRRSLRDLIWPAIRLSIWVVIASAVFIALSNEQDPLTVLVLLALTASVAEPIARWVQSATTVRLPMQIGTPPEVAS